MPSMVIGAKGDVGDVETFLQAIRREARRLGLQVQAFDADMVFGDVHLLSALEHAERAFHQGTNVASDLMMEVMVYAAGERQISRAVEKMGVKRGKDRTVLLIVGEGDVGALIQKLDLARDDAVILGERKFLVEYGIPEAELETVAPDRIFDLVLERVALVDVLK